MKKIKEHTIRWMATILGCYLVFMTFIGSYFFWQNAIHTTGISRAVNAFSAVGSIALSILFAVIGQQLFIQTKSKAQPAAPAPRKNPRSRKTS